MTSLMTYSQFLLSRLDYHFPSDLNNEKKNILLLRKVEKVAQKACMRKAGTSFFPIELCPKDRLSGNASPRVKIWRTNSIQRETFSNGQYPVANMDLSKGWSFKTSSSWVKRMFTGCLESCGRRGDGTGEHESWCHHLHWYFVYWTIFSSDNFLSL